MQILKGHTSPETAYVVDDYPYGFRLRCKIRYWLEYKKGKGFRLVSQTSNPKRPGLVWNKPKASTYSILGGCMYLDEQWHVTWTSIHQYTDTEALVAWGATYGDTMPEEAQVYLRRITAAKVAYDAKRNESEDRLALPLNVGLKEAYVAFAKA